ncbi:mycothione reductase [Arsenicicoccus dermatophilus]|uniref:mycothione reductase n=1 Tax=Arsenicicoccus dermatophilus TaxID=1076331 RepID=UPI001F4D194D|nr:mycothione reductase [Arsenicicoccus dermatophilus]MCH8614127.1 mycothione reductase [Arsenicicoccus dermatophilus]
MADRHFDLIIIGTGSGNSLLTPELEGRDVAILERGVFGGTCLNVGCIPTKMFAYPADVVTEAADLQRLGISYADPQVRWQEIRDRVFGRIDPIARGGEDYRRQDPHVTVFSGSARFTAPTEIDTGTGATITAEQIVIAAGARPTMLPVDGLREVDPDAGIHTSDTVMRMPQLPRRMAVIGGGYIACEFAHVFDALGVDVVWLQRSDLLLRSQDELVSRVVTDAAAERFDLRLETEVRSATRQDDGWHLALSTGGEVVVAAVLVAVGRTRNGDQLGLAEVGYRMEDGRLWVDEHQRTSVEGVWALGDVSSPYQLKHVANHEARVVAHNLAHPDDLRSTDHRFVPAAVFGHPQVASVGATERELRAAGRDHVVTVQRYGDTAYGWAMEDQAGVCKLLADPQTKQLLGAHLVGHQASLLVQPLVQAMSLGTTVPQMARGQYWTHPALVEVVENALLGLDL